MYVFQVLNKIPFLGMCVPGVVKQSPFFRCVYVFQVLNKIPFLGVCVPGATLG